MKHLARLSFLTALMLVIQTGSYTYACCEPKPDKYITFVFDNKEIEVKGLKYEKRTYKDGRTYFWYNIEFYKECNEDIQMIQTKLGKCYENLCLKNEQGDGFNIEYMGFSVLSSTIKHYHNPKPLTK